MSGRSVTRSTSSTTSSCEYASGPPIGIAPRPRGPAAHSAADSRDVRRGDVTNRARSVAVDSHPAGVDIETDECREELLGEIRRQQDRVLQPAAFQPSLRRALEAGQRRFRVDTAAERNENDVTHAIPGAGSDQVLQAMTVDGFEESPSRRDSVAVAVMMTVPIPRTAMSSVARLLEVRHAKSYAGGLEARCAAADRRSRTMATTE